MTDIAYTIKLDIFEGPMDLLLYLVKKNDLDIYNIPISFITDNYLAHLSLMEFFDIDYAAEFLYMAAILTQIKSRMLLPHPFEETAEEDLLLNLTAPLAEYLSIKNAAEYLSKMEQLGQDVFTRMQIKNPEPHRHLSSINLTTLFNNYVELIDALPSSHKIHVEKESLSLDQRIDDIITFIEKNSPTQFQNLIETNHSKDFLITTFLAVLELAKREKLQCHQNTQNGTITIHCHCP